MGKYDAITPLLPKLQPDDPSRQQKIDAVKNGVTNRDAIPLATEFIRLRLLKDDMESDLKAVNLMIEVYEQLLAESQEAERAGWGEYGVKENALRLPDGDTVRIEIQPYGQVKDKEAFRLWCLKNGYERQMHLWPSTTNAVVKERLFTGDPSPDGCEAFQKTTVKYVKKGSAE